MNSFKKMPKRACDVPKKVSEAYEKMKNVDFYYSDSQDERVIQEERNRQSQIDKTAEIEFKRFCFAFGYSKDIIDSSEFFNVLESDYYNKYYK